MHPRLTVSQASTIHWPLERDLELYERLGIGRVGVLLRKLEVAGLERGSEALRASGIAVDNLAVGPVFDLGAPGAWPAARERLAEIVDLARELGSDCVVVTSGNPGRSTWEEAADAFAEAIGPAIVSAAARGVEVAVEHTNGFRFDISFLHNLRDTVDLAERVGFAICVEVNNIWVERDLAGTIRRGAPRMRIVQLNDFVVGTLATPDRAVPGDGDIPLDRIVTQLALASYSGPFELEIVGPRIEAEGYEAAVSRSLAYLTRVLTAAGI